MVNLCKKPSAPLGRYSLFIDLRSSLLTLGIAQASLALLSLNRSLLHSSLFTLHSSLQSMISAPFSARSAGFSATMEAEFGKQIVKVFGTVQELALKHKAKRAAH